MNNERNALKAGLFIVVSIVAAGFIIVGVKGTLRVVEPSEDRQVTFKLSDNLSGLGKGDDLRLGGYKVGIVKGIHVITENTPMASRASKSNSRCPRTISCTRIRR